jgi:hypothetical protein
LADGRVRPIRCGAARPERDEANAMMELLLTLLVGAVFCGGVFALWVGRSFHPPSEHHHEHTYQHHPHHEHTPSP